MSNGEKMSPAERARLLLKTGSTGICDRAQKIRDANRANGARRRVEGSLRLGCSFNKRGIHVQEDLCNSGFTPVICPAATNLGALARQSLAPRPKRLYTPESTAKPSTITTAAMKIFARRASTS